MSGPTISDPRTGHQHAIAVVQALFVTFLWSTSWVLVKIGLDDLGLQPLSFAGLRYALAAAILLPFGIRAMRAAHAETPLSGRLLARVAVYGVLFVAVAQGAQFVALAVLPATAVSLILSSIPVWVAALALAGGTERPTVWQASTMSSASASAHSRAASATGCSVPTSWLACCRETAAVVGVIARDIAATSTVPARFTPTRVTVAPVIA